MNEDKLKISNFIFSLLKIDVSIVNEKDLLFSLNSFIESEDYEKCSIINKSLQSKEFNNDLISYSNLYITIQKGKENIKGLLNAFNDLPSDDRIEKNKLKCKELLDDLDISEESFWKKIDEYGKNNR